MRNEGSRTFEAVQRFWEEFRNELVQPVPEAVESCEFDCSDVICTADEWKRCKIRLVLSRP